MSGLPRFSKRNFLCTFVSRLEVKVLVITRKV